MVKSKNILYVFAFFTFIAIITSLQVYFSGTAEKFGISYQTLLLLHLSSWYLWAILSPVIYFLAVKFPLSKTKWLKSIVINIFSSLIIAFVHIFLENITNAIFEGAALFDERFNKNLINIALFSIHKDILVYWLLLLASHAYLYFINYKSERSNNEGLRKDINQLEAKVEEFELNGKGRLKKIAIKNKGRTIYLKIENIDWIEAADYYIEINVSGKKYLLRESLNNIEKQLDKNKFYRIHRSHIINVEKIKELEHLNKGDYLVTLYEGTQLKMSRSRKKELSKLIGKSQFQFTSL